MPAVVAASFLEKNLAALGERNADVAAKLREIDPAPDVLFSSAADGCTVVERGGRALCSRHRPLDEADRLVASLDLLDRAVFVMLGFGAGHHVRRLAERTGRVGLLVVLETDLPLLRAVLEQVDHSAWLKQALVVWITDAGDRGTLARKLEGAEAIIAQGVEYVEHPSSRPRLAEDIRRFTAAFGEMVLAAKTTLVTTLVRSVDTVRNFVLNVDHYVGGEGIMPLRDAAIGRLAVIVSAGPSLRRNLHLLKQPHVRERCVIVAVQTMLKPLLDQGIRPHFVTALDYHEISRRFYEGLDPNLLHDVTLLADPKVHPAVIDAYPGPVRCCAGPFLDQLLSEMRRDMGELPPGATVAHLSLYLARFLGCNPIALIGQDLGFTDGLYYTPGTAIHDVWSTELNPFNTIEMMEWQRIVRHRRHLSKLRDVHGKSIYTDMQMVTYLQQFERDFAKFGEEGLTIIDATEGGVLKQHCVARALRQVLEEHASTEREPMPPLPLPPRDLDRQRLQQAARRLEQVRRETASIRQASLDAMPLLEQMLRDQDDLRQMERHFTKMDRHRAVIERHFATFSLLNNINQLGVFKRLKADRRLHLLAQLGPVERQRGQLERDLDNVRWIADAAEEMFALLSDGQALLAGQRVEPRRPGPDKVSSIVDAPEAGSPATGSIKPPPARVAALVPIDPDRGGLGTARSLAEWPGARSMLQATLEQLARVRRLDEIVLIAPHGFDVEGLIERERLPRPVHVERCDGSPFPPAHEAIAAARRWADTCWRGGIAGMTVHDEVLCPRLMHEIMQRRGITAAIPVAPDWPLVDPSDTNGIDAVIARHLEHPQQHRIVFTQAPPGVGACLISAPLMAELAEGHRLGTVGALLGYLPHLPQHDPIARDANVQIDHNVRRSMVRAVGDTPRWRRCVSSSRRECDGVNDASTLMLLQSLESTAESDAAWPRHVVIELTTERLSDGVFSRQPFGSIDRAPMTRELLDRILSVLAGAECLVTFDGVGDPLLHPQLGDFIALARARGVAGIHVRTELLAPPAALDQLLAEGIDVVSVDLHADRAATYEVMMGSDRFKEVLLNIEHLMKNRRRLSPHAGNLAFALPWIVPRLQRRAETYEDIDSFYDRWMMVLGTAVIEGLPRFNPTSQCPADTLAEAVTPPRVVRHQLRRRMTILSDGSAPVSELDLAGRRCVGNVHDQETPNLWRDVLRERERLEGEQGPDCEELRTWRP